MKNYLKSFTTYFIGMLLVLHFLVFLMLFGMWELGRFWEMYESNGFWSLIKIGFIFSLILPMFYKFKIVKI